jgi:hypothetical protein
LVSGEARQLPVELFPDAVEFAFQIARRAVDAISLYFWDVVRR